MRTTKLYPSELPRCIFRSELTHCLSCGTRLRRFATLSRRVIITQDGPLRMTHCGYRCPTPACPTAGRTYRSARADALALPGFTYGLDWIFLVGHVRLAKHLSLDQTHAIVQERLAPWQLSISRREILYLFDAYCSLFRATHEWSSTPPWRQELLAQGGVILAIDGIQPDKGNETIYLVRDVLTGRLLAAENLLASEARVLSEALLAPLAGWDLPVLGVITDGQESLRQAVAATWPEVPHQVCQFHALREAGRLMYERDRAVKVHLRKAVQERIRVVRRQLEREVPEDPHAAEQIQILAEYAAGIQALINRDGLQPFRFAALAMDQALGEVDQSLAALEKKGALTDWTANRLARLRTIVQLRHDWAGDLACLRLCHTWLLQAEALLSPQPDTPATEEAVAGWLASLEQLPEAICLPPIYAKCLHHFIGVLGRLQPYLLSWTKEARLPRTNNDLERFIRALKTRYRRISGRKNWNAYLLRYGRRTAFYEDAVQHHDAVGLLEQRLRSLAATCWGPARHQQRPLDLRLRTQYHFLHPRAQTLRLLEQRWAQTTDGT